MRVGEQLELADHSSAFGPRLVITDRQRDKDGISLDRVEAEQLREACDRFIRGERLPR